MHEHSLAAALVERVEAESAGRAGAEVRRDHVRIGELAGVAIDPFRGAWDALRARSRLAGAELVVRAAPARWECPRCRSAIARGARLSCPACGSAARLVAGDEILLERIELEGSQRESCAGGDPGAPIEIQAHILEGNDRVARRNRERFEEAGVLAVNLLGSAGAGKTTVLEATAGAAPGHRFAALAADPATDRDAARLAAAGISSRAITTGSAGHLDARMVHRALQDLSIATVDLLFIENLGNLVCPAIYDLGQGVNVVALAVTEGEGKPLEVPVTFRRADLVLITKIDLAPRLDVDLDAIHDALAHAMPRPRALAISARTGAGMEAWLAWLAAQPRPGRSRRPATTSDPRSRGRRGGPRG